MSLLQEGDGLSYGRFGGDNMLRGADSIRERGLPRKERGYVSSPPSFRVGDLMGDLSFHRITGDYVENEERKSKVSAKKTPQTLDKARNSATRRIYRDVPKEEKLLSNKTVVTLLTCWLAFSGIVFYGLLRLNRLAY